LGEDDEDEEREREVEDDEGDSDVEEGDMLDSSFSLSSRCLSDSGERE
jgi:hypothetical protein